MNTSSLNAATSSLPVPLHASQAPKLRFSSQGIRAPSHRSEHIRCTQFSGHSQRRIGWNLGKLRSSRDGFVKSMSERSDEVLIELSKESDEVIIELSKESDSEEPGTLLGAIALITGTSVGAGILALPAETSPAGFIPSAAMLLLCWGFLTFEALLLAQINIQLAKKLESDKSVTSISHSEVLSIQTMAEMTLGPMGGFLAGSTYLFLSVSLMVAYISKSAEVLTIATSIPSPVTGALFTLVLGGSLFKGGTRAADVINQILTSALLVFFGMIVCGGSTFADWTQLEQCDWSASSHVLPIVFLSLVYHDLVPVLCNYFRGDAKKVNTSIILGSTVPLVMLLSWDAVALSVGGASGDPLQTLMRSGDTWQSLIVIVFSLLATATSFIGSTLSLSEFSVEQIGAIYNRSVSEAGNKGTRKDLDHKGTYRTSLSSRMGSFPDLWNQASTMGENLVSSVKSLFVSAMRSGEGDKIGKEKLRLLSYLSILLPPLFIAGTNPDAFFQASEVAGAYGMTVLYGIFPPAMAWGLYKSQHFEEEGKQSFDMPGGGVSLALLAAGAVAVITSQAMLDINGSAIASSSDVILAATEEAFDEDIHFLDGQQNIAPSPRLIG